MLSEKIMRVCHVVVPMLALLLMLITVAQTEDVSIMAARSEPEYETVKDVTQKEIINKNTPIGVQKRYTFTLEDTIANGECIAFYTVHQYVTVWLNGEKVYSLKPSGSHRFTKTVGCNWVMIPLYIQDSKKEVRVDITPVYKSFKERKVTFLIGTSLAIYKDRLKKDLPQMILGGMAIFIGIVFVGMAVYSLFKRSSGKRLVALGIFSVMLGFWKINDTRFTPFMDHGKPVLFYYIAITMLIFGILPLLHWIKGFFKGKGRKVFDVYETEIEILCMVLFILQWLGIYDLRESISAVHIAIEVGAAIVLAFIIKKKRKGDVNGEMSIQIRFVFLCVMGVFIDVLTFYVKGNSSGLLCSLVSLIIYIMCMGIHMMFEYGRQQVEIAKLDRELAQKEHTLTDGRIKMMMSQIRSHFIFNVLATISTYCKIDPQMADKALICFSRYLRRNIHIIEVDGLIDFSSELEQLDDYVTLEQMRFAEEITFEKDIETSSFKIPPLTVQPIVENAIKHGLVEHGKKGTVFLHTERKRDTIEITVTDDGVGFATEMLEKTESVGIRNVRYRLENMAGGTLKVESEPGSGTKVTIQIPQKE